MRQVTYTCATYEKGCPCNEEWEIECESYGYKERLHVSTRGIAGKDKHNQVMIWVWKWGILVYLQDGYLQLFTFFHWIFFLGPFFCFSGGVVLVPMFDTNAESRTAPWNWDLLPQVGGLLRPFCRDLWHGCSSVCFASFLKKMKVIISLLWVCYNMLLLEYFWTCFLLLSFKEQLLRVIKNH